MRDNVGGDLWRDRLCQLLLTVSRLENNPPKFKDLRDFVHKFVEDAIRLRMSDNKRTVVERVPGVERVSVQQVVTDESDVCGSEVEVVDLCDSAESSVVAVESSVERVPVCRVSVPMRKTLDNGPAPAYELRRLPSDYDCDLYRSSVGSSAAAIPSTSSSHTRKTPIRPARSSRRSRSSTSSSSRSTW